MVGEGGVGVVLDEWWWVRMRVRVLVWCWRGSRCSRRGSSFAVVPVHSMNGSPYVMPSLGFVAVHVAGGVCLDCIIVRREATAKASRMGAYDHAFVGGNIDDTGPYKTPLQRALDASQRAMATAASTQSLLAATSAHTARPQQGSPAVPTSTPHGTSNHSLARGGGRTQSAASSSSSAAAAAVGARISSGPVRALPLGGTPSKADIIESLRDDDSDVAGPPPGDGNSILKRLMAARASGTTTPVLTPGKKQRPASATMARKW